jgi:hypothetical protein
MKRVSRLWRRLVAQPGRWPRLVVLAACALIAAMYLTNDDMANEPNTPRGDGRYLPILDRGDGHMLYLMARSTALDFDWKFDNDLKRFGDPWQQPVNKITGRKENPHPIGPALVWTPLIWIAEAGAVAANALGAEIPLHGYTLWHQRFVFFSSAFAGCLAVWLGRRVARQALGAAPWAIGYAAFAVLLGTPITYYASYMPSYGHALDAAACGGFLAVWVLTLGRWEWRRWLVLGALLGLAMLIRAQDVAFGIVIVVEVVTEIIGDLRRRAVDWRVRALGWLGGGAIVLATAFVVFIPQLVYWHVVYGSALSLPQGAKYTRFGSPMMLEILWAPRNGWLSSTPVAYLGVIGLFCLPRRARVIAIGLGAAVFAQVYLNSTILDWWGMNSFGNRRLCSVTLPLVVGLAALLWRCSRLRIPRAVKHAVAVLVLAPMLLWNLWRAHDHSRGRAPTADLEAACCDRAPEKLRGTLRWVFDRIGDPFEFPANAYFALRHDVSIQDWDSAAGDYPLMPSAKSLTDDTWYLERGAWRIGYPKAEPYLVGVWTGVAGADRSFRWTASPRVRVIVPNLVPDGQHYMLWLAPGGATDVRVAWDDREVAHVTLHPGWNPIEWNDESPSTGFHEITIDATPGPFVPPEGWPKAPGSVGVAVNLLELTYLAP